MSTQISKCAACSEPFARRTGAASKGRAKTKTRFNS